MRNIAIFASGSGTNAENIIKYFSNRKTGKVSLVLSDKHEAYVLRRAAKHNIESLFFEHIDFYTSDEVLNTLLKHKIDFVVLAGFMLLIPENIIDNFEGRIVNIHPALLPKYGGKGMYGERVHNHTLC
jgi:phosphoribosylglycinamide formyltransferase-1